jgi:hypothetical protein
MRLYENLAAAALAAGLSTAAAAAASIPVTVVNPSLPVTGTVGVATGKTNPLFVDTDASARSAFTASCTAPYDSSGIATCTLAAVPTGQAAVIETVSCNASLVQANPPDALLQLPVLLGFTGPVLGGGTQGQIHELVLTHWLGLPNSNPPLDYYALGAAQVRITAVAGNTPLLVQAQVGGAQPASASLSCTVSGHTASL